MKAEREDRPIYQQKAKRLNPWVVVTVITAINAAVLFTLAKTGWGITVDLDKLSEAIYVNGTKQVQDVSPQTAEPLPEPLAFVPSANPVEIPIGPRQRPVDYSVSLMKFNSIFIHHPACNPHEMKWTQLDCSNFRARAMKRFHIEWGKNSYWNGYKVMENEAADKIVNMELNN
ncbi:hypothetical protein D6Z43_24490 [Pseudomonas sp. DY-1]|uniref:hypothetical protein n=1 Tax=Pseudomonas sp. DY-1 TaxID=1755504 RepID=UPI000EA8623C|nr:hypothetical protein [Pseudomonas sp. DY-1]AYF90138.1 hypothetical protein D6Z43_24490 [Pseudomonas sp. DY-1]